MSARRIAALLAAALATLASVARPAHATASDRPNVVVIETDDQTAADLAAMPRTRRLIGRAGVTFRRSFVSLSQCCPSRATFLTGQYAHNHGVLTTQPPFGGFPAFDDAETLAVWLRRAGYQTALAGKYLNEYGRHERDYVPPGWTEWHALAGPSVYNFARFRFDGRGRVRRYRGWYQTDAITHLAEGIVRRRAGTRRPLFLWVTYVAPHVAGPKDVLDPPRMTATVSSPLMRGAFLGARMPRSPAFDEADVSDKPQDIRDRRAFAPWTVRRIAEEWRRRQEALISVDLGVQRIVRALRARHALDDTLLIFTSDNGYMLGEHRVPFGKIVPYEPSIRVPLLMRGPGIPHGARRDQLAWNGDLAPTILDAAGARAPWETDGESLLPFARDVARRSPRAVLLEGPPLGRTDATPRFTGLRTTRYLYVEHAGGEVELYDVRRDPDELRNLAGTPAAAPVRRRLARRLAALRHCSGAACRT